jgi:hypothetical protein
MFGMKSSSHGSSTTSDSINVYWAPILNKNGLEQSNKNIFYKNPKTLFSSLYSDKTENVSAGNTLFSCPVTSKKMKSTYVFNAPTSATYEFEDNKVYLKESETQYVVDMKILRLPAIQDTNIILYDAEWIFFSEEDLIAEFYQPYLHKTSYLNSAALLTGEFNIGSWFRPFSVEFMTWQKNGEIEIKEDPLFYVQFKTDKQINLVRFNWSRPLESLKNSCMSHSTLGPNKKSLEFRYNQFKESSTRDLVLKEILTQTL